MEGASAETGPPLRYMSELGQNRKYSLRADVFRSCTDNGHRVGAGEFVPAAFVMWQRGRDSLTSVDKNMVEAIDGKASGEMCASGII
jgi:hypothetical protein